jgi:alkylation response protein AidB-like acyl-CoA dehydrogenase
MNDKLHEAISIAKEAEVRHQEIDNIRNIPTDLMTNIKAAGLVKMWSRKECGGAELSVLEVCNIISGMAFYNGSVAWVTSVTNCSSLITGFVSEKIARNLFENEDAMIGGFAGPSGIATIEGESLKVKGKWSWGSGITHCSHIVAGVAIMNDNKMIGTAVVFLNPEEVTFHDNWHVLGLKGTHSIDYSVDSAVIPGDRWTYFPVKAPLSKSPLYKFSFLGALSVSIAAVGLGLAKRAVVEIEEIAKTKSPFGVGKALADRPDFQERLAISKGQLNAAESLLLQTIEKVEREIKTDSCSLLSRASLRLAATHATTMNTEVVNNCYHLAGGSSIWKESKLEELFRDMNVVSQHGMVNRGNYRTVGAVALERDVPEVML